MDGDGQGEMQMWMERLWESIREAMADGQRR
jgi:hypothetical protein